MGAQVHFNASAQLYENDAGALAIRLADNRVYEDVGVDSGKSFVADALELLTRGQVLQDWHEVPYRKLQHDDQGWHLVGSMGFLEGDESRPALLLEIEPDALGQQAKCYLQADLPEALQ